jgi:hypothetical protein
MCGTTHSLRLRLGKLATVPTGTTPTAAKEAFPVAVFRTASGQTLNLRGLNRNAGSAKYEFAYEMDARGRVDVPTGTGAKARRTIARLRGAGR